MHLLQVFLIHTHGALERLDQGHNHGGQRRHHDLGENADPKPDNHYRRNCEYRDASCGNNIRIQDPGKGFPPP